MGVNLGKWTELEKNLLKAGASNDIMHMRTGRTHFSISSARSKLGKVMGKRIIPLPDSRFLAEERRKMREFRKMQAEVRKAGETQVKELVSPKKGITIEELRKNRPKEWVPTASGAGVMCVPAKKVILRDNIIKHKGTLEDQMKPLDPKTIHQETGKAPFTKVEPEVLDPKVDEAIQKMMEEPGITVINPTPSKDELFFVINGTRVTVSAGTKSVDLTPYGLIIEF